MIATFFLLVGCLDSTAVHVAETTPDIDVVEEDLTFSFESVLAARPFRVAIAGSIPEDGFLELRPYRAGDEELWVGWPVATAAVATGDFASSLALPLRAPRRDRDAADPWAPVIYALSLRSMDASGYPAHFIGMSGMEVAYVPADPDTEHGAAVGWNIVWGYDTDAPEYFPVTDGLQIQADLLGPDTVEVGGTAAIDWPETMHVALYDPNLPVQPEAPLYDQPARPMWSIAQDLAPPEEHWLEDAVLEGAMVDVVAYQDLDGSNDLTAGVETVAGVACHGSNPVALTWFARPLAFDTAHAMRQIGLRAGWSAMERTQAGLSTFDGMDFTSLIIAETCGAPPPEAAK